MIDPHAPELTPELIAIADEFGVTLRSKYVGKANAITAARISEGYARRGIKVTRHELCPMVNYLRSNGALVGSCKNGYYWCESEEEIAETVDQLRGRIAGIERALSGMSQEALAKIL